MKTRISIILIFLASSVALFGQEKREVFQGTFTGIRCMGAAKWKLIASDEEKIVVETSNAEVFDYVQTSLNGGILFMDARGKNMNISKLFSEVTFLVYYKSIDHIVLDGAGIIESEDAIRTDQLYANLKGSGKIDLEIDCKDFEGWMQGTSYFSVRGECNIALVRVTGVGSFSGLELFAEQAEVRVDGVGHATIHVKERLDARLNGVGSIKYAGNPSDKNFDINGLGTIKPYEP